ncbi:Hypothetical protein FKW44_016627, partial [Caligus rogercresseyi]
LRSSKMQGHATDLESRRDGCNQISDLTTNHWMHHRLNKKGRSLSVTAADETNKRRKE